MSHSAPVITVANMPPEYLERFNATRAYIVNITDIDYHLSRTYGNYHVRANAAGEEFTVTEIAPRKGTMDYGDGKRLDFPITPRDVADDLCREINVDAGWDSFLGVFVSKASEPTVSELKDAHKRLEKFYAWGVEEGDKIWQQSRTVMLIPDWISGPRITSVLSATGKRMCSRIMSAQVAGRALKQKSRLPRLRMRPR